MVVPDDLYKGREVCLDALRTIAALPIPLQPGLHSLPLTKDTPYVEYFLNKEQLRLLGKGLEERKGRDHDRDDDDDRGRNHRNHTTSSTPLNPNPIPNYQSHPSLKLKRDTLVLNPQPPRSLVQLLKAKGGVMVGTLSSGFIYSQHPHGLYPFTSLWVHHHPAFEPFRNRIENELKRVGGGEGGGSGHGKLDLNHEIIQNQVQTGTTIPKQETKIVTKMRQPRTEMVKDEVGNLRPVFNRYQFVPLSPPTFLISAHIT